MFIYIDIVKKYLGENNSQFLFICNFFQHHIRSTEMSIDSLANNIITDITKGVLRLRELTETQEGVEVLTKLAPLAIKISNLVSCVETAILSQKALGAAFVEDSILSRNLSDVTFRNISLTFGSRGYYSSLINDLYKVLEDLEISLGEDSEHIRFLNKLFSVFQNIITDLDKRGESPDPGFVSELKRITMEAVIYISLKSR
jgi:hypothetical protein